MTSFSRCWQVIVSLGLLLYTGAAGSVTLEVERAWIEQAALLVEAARTSSAEAGRFNGAVLESRVALRKLVRESRQLKLDDNHRKLHSQMILLDILLKSAASCQDAGRIVCPPMLMLQLNTVLKNAREQWQQVRTSLKSP